MPWLLQHLQYTDPSPSTSWPSLRPASSFCMPFNLPALVYIVCVTIRVLLAAIMKGTVLICCFLSLLLLQATAGKTFGNFGQISCGFCLFDAGWCTVGMTFVCVQMLLMNEIVMCKLRAWFNECLIAPLAWWFGESRESEAVIRTVITIRKKTSCGQK